MSFGGYSWIDDVRERRIPTEQVAAELGMRVGRNHRIGPCPSCNRNGGPRDSRPPVGVNVSTGGWRCFHCDCTGDGLTLVAVLLTGQRKPGDVGWRKVRAWYAARGWCEPDGMTAEPRPAPLRVAAPEPELEYPPAEEVAAMLSATLPARKVPVVADWLTARRMPLDVPARVLPADLAVPSWWPAKPGDYPLVVPACDAEGVIRSLHARTIWSEESLRARGYHNAPKTIWPRGCKCGGLLFADPLVARPMMRGERVTVKRIVVAEGLTDYIAAAAAWASVERGVGVIGATSGGFHALRDANIPEGAQVILATDNDAHGEKYADQVREALNGRIYVRLRLRRVDPDEAAREERHDEVPPPPDVEPPDRAPTLPFEYDDDIMYAPAYRENDDG